MLAFLIILPPRAIREQQAVQVTPHDCASSARQLEVIVFYLTAAAVFLACQQAKESPQSSYVGDTKTVSHFALPEQSPLRPARNSRPKMGVSSKPSRFPGTRCPVIDSFFLAIAPSFSSTRVHSLALRCFSLFLFPSVLPTAADPARAGSLSPSVIFLPRSSLCLLPLQAGSPKTHDSLTMNNQYGYWSGENVCKFLKGNQEQGQGGSWRTTLQCSTAGGGRTTFGSQVSLAPRWRVPECVRTRVCACEEGVLYSHFSTAAFPEESRAKWSGSSRQRHVLAAGQHCFVFIITRYFAICINTGLFFIVSPKR